MSFGHQFTAFHGVVKESIGPAGRGAVAADRQRHAPFIARGQYGDRPAFMQKLVFQ